MSDGKYLCPDVPVAPLSTRKRKNNKMSKKTLKTLSRIANSTDTNVNSNTSAKQFGGTIKVHLSELATPKSVYSGAGIKLDAFDCFHKALNECVCDYTFSIANAALVLKQLTPDIIKKIVPMMSQQQLSSPKKETKQTDKTEYYEGAIDPEVSEINTEKRELLKSSSCSRKNTIKRPDASRTTCLLSPGSNSCSPVSAAVQALISISAPSLEGTATNTVVQSQRKKIFNEKTVSNSNMLNDNMADTGSVFIPLSKPITSNVEFTDPVLAPVPKPAFFASSCEEVLPGYTAPNEVPEVFVVPKSDTFEPSHFGMTPIMESHPQAISDVPTVTSNSGGVVTVSSSSSVISNEQLHPIINKTLSADDPLPHFNLLLNSSALSSDLTCGIPSPFQTQMPSSPMPTLSTQNQLNILTKSSHLDLNVPSFVSRSTSGVTQAFDQAPMTMTDESLQGNRVLNLFRTILPKPYPEISVASVMSVLPLVTAATTSAVSQLSPVIKIDERKNVQYSVPPNQIFTKLNTISATQFPAMSAASSGSQRTFFGNPNYFFSPQMEALLYPQQNKDFKQLIAVPVFNENLSKTKTPGQSNAKVSEQKVSKASENYPMKPENPGGHLEVASALLSMGTEAGESGKDTSNENESIRNIIQESLKNEPGISVNFTENGIIKIDEVEIDPSRHQIKADNFQCGKCKRVFTSVLYLARHIKRVCPDMSQRKWKCDRCSKAFRHPFGLQQHIYTHTGERPHKCDQCAKAFYSANDLRRHVRTHSGERPYACSHCDKHFSTTISLRTHTYIHTGERPHKCPHCVKTFATSSKLSRHIVTHSEKRPYPCDQCAKTFNRSGDLRRHYIQHHGSSLELLECNQCNKVFATQKCLTNHKATHKRDILPGAEGQNQVVVPDEEMLKRAHHFGHFEPVQ